MRATLAIMIIFAAACAGAEDRYIFATNLMFVARGSERACPVQAVRLTDRKLVIGLPVLTDAERAACGYYRCLTNPPPVAVSNESYRLVGYMTLSSGCAERVYMPYTPRPRVKTYSKYLITRALMARGKYALFKEVVTAAGYWDLWLAAENLTSDDQQFAEIRGQIGSALELSDAEIDAILEECQWQD